MLPKWWLGVCVLGVGWGAAIPQTAEMRRKLLSREFNWKKEEVQLVCVFFAPPPFIFPAFSDLIRREITNWSLAAAPCVHNRTH